MNYLIFVIVGGIGTFWGPIVGSAVLTILPELLRFSSTLRYVVLGVALLLIVIFRSQGLITRRPIGAAEPTVFGRLWRRSNNVVVAARSEEP